MSQRQARVINDADAQNPKALHGQFVAWTKILEVSDFVLSKEGQVEQERLWVCKPIVVEISKL